MSYIRDFIEAVYPDAPDLALTNFNEKVCLKDATEKIRALQTERDDLELSRDNWRASCHQVETKRDAAVRDLVGIKAMHDAGHVGLDRAGITRTVDLPHEHVRDRVLGLYARVDLLRQERDTLRARVTELVQERDSAYKQGVEDAHRCEQRHARLDALERVAAAARNTIKENPHLVEVGRLRELHDALAEAGGEGEER